MAIGSSFRHIALLVFDTIFAKRYAQYCTVGRHAEVSKIFVRIDSLYVATGSFNVLNGCRVLRRRVQLTLPTKSTHRSHGVLRQSRITYQMETNEEFLHLTFRETGWGIAL